MGGIDRDIMGYYIYMNLYIYIYIYISPDKCSEPVEIFQNARV